MTVKPTITRCDKLLVYASLKQCRKLAKKLGFSIHIRKNGWFRYQLVKNNYDVFGLAWGTIITLQEALEKMLSAKQRGCYFYGCD